MLWEYRVASLSSCVVCLAVEHHTLGGLSDYVKTWCNRSIRTIECGLCVTACATWIYSCLVELTIVFPDLVVFILILDITITLRTLSPNGHPGL